MQGKSLKKKKNMLLLFIGGIMTSRMEKYYRNNSNIKKRSQKNQDLYRNIYDMGEYTNIEAVATLEKTNEIDISKIKDMLKDRESYKKQKQYRQILHEEKKEEPVVPEFDLKDDKVYDIRDVLTKAKNKRPKEESFRSLDNTNYNILKNLELNNDKIIENEEDELKELINTITSTSMLNQMNDKELGLNMLDLDSNDNTTIEDNKSIKMLLEEAKANDEKNKKIDDTDTIDNSFYTSSLNFNKEDFEEADKIINKKSKKKLLLKIIFIIMLLIITGLIIYGVYSLIK